MTTKELIQAEVEQLREEDLDELYKLVKSFSESRKQIAGKSLMSKLRSIKIEAPEDFAANFDLYVSGEKSADANLR